MNSATPLPINSDQLSYQLLVDSVKEYAIFMLDATGRIISWNQGAERIKDYTADEIIGRHFSCFYLLEDVLNGIPETNLVIAAREGKFEAEGWRLRKDGSRFWANVVITPLYNNDGTLSGYAKVTRDLTERKLAEETLRASEEKMRAIMDNAADGIMSTDDKGIIQSINRAGAALCGYTPADLVGRSINLLIPEPICGKHDQYLSRYQQTGQTRVIGIGPREVVGQHRDGHPVPLELAFSETHVAGQRTFIGIIRDISQRKRHEDLLRATNETLEARVQERTAQWRAIFEHGPAAMTKIDLSGRLLEVNAKFCEMVGYPAEELKHLTWKDLGSAEDIAKAEPLLQKLLAGEFDNYTREKIFNRKDGSTVMVESSLSLVRDATGHPLYFIGIGTDITDRKLAETARQESEAAYRAIFEQAAVGIAHVNLSGKIILANQKYADILGYTIAEIEGMTIQSIIHPDDLPKKLESRQRLLTGEIPSYNLELRLVRKDGTIAWVRLNSSLGREIDTGLPTHTIGIAEDITAQKQTEQALEESQRRLTVAAQASALGVWELDVTTGMCWLSANMTEILGFAPTEQIITFENLLERVHPDDMPLTESRLRRMVLEGGAEHGDTRIIRPNGEEHWLASAVQSIADAAGNNIKLIGASMDITSRKQAEQQLRQLSIHLQDVREEERKRLAREIHDELGGALTAIKFDLTLASRQEENNPGLKSLRNETTVAQVDAAIASLRRIISDLRPSVLDDLGLWAALEWQAHDFKTRTGITCSYYLEGEEIDVAPETATALFRMVQEALTNVLRHAHATFVSIRASVTPDEISIRIQDNGVGIPADRIKGRQSYGLLGLQERARQLHGSVTIGGHMGKGTQVRILLPLKRSA